MLSTLYHFYDPLSLSLSLSGTPHNSLTLEEILSNACREADIYRRCGVHGVIVENMHDRPYLRNGVGSEVTSCMTRIASEVRKVVSGMLLGVQILSCK